MERCVLVMCCELYGVMECMMCCGMYHTIWLSEVYWCVCLCIICYLLAWILVLDCGGLLLRGRLRAVDDDGHGEMRVFGAEKSTKTAAFAAISPLKRGG